MDVYVSEGTERDGGNSSFPPCVGESKLLTISRMLSSTVLLTTLMYKLPQMKVIISTGSTTSLSLSAVIVEWIAYTIMLTYQFAQGYPHYTFFESNVTVLQDFVLILLILKNRNLIEARILPFYCLYIIFFIVMCTNMLPPRFMFMAIGATTPLLIWSKVTQLMTIWRNGTSGSISSITWLIATYNTAVRILTTAYITKDFPMFVNLVSSEVLNIAVLFSVIYFQVKAPSRRSRER